jgi:tRNA(Ile)-lysidine synthase
LNGDSIQLSGGTKKVKDLFIDKKIKKELRDEIPMVINGNDIIWIPGVARSSLIKDDLESGDIYLIYEEK